MKKKETEAHLDLGLDVFNGVAGLHLEGDGLAGEGLHEDLHCWCFVALLCALWFLFFFFFAFIEAPRTKSGRGIELQEKEKCRIWG